MNIKFKIGDKVKAVNTVYFLWDEPHKMGQEFIVTEENLEYFNKFWQDYDLSIDKNDHKGTKYEQSRFD